MTTKTKALRFLLFLLASGVFLIADGFFAHLMADDAPFTYPANSGFTGIMEIPTARIMKENNFRAGVSQIDPYRYYYLAVSPFEWVELSGAVTEILGVKASDTDPNFQGYGNTKDKSFGVKFRLLKESKWLPAVALSIMDPQGTRLYPSQSIVASKQIYPFDFTIGLGNGRFGKKPLASSGDSVKAEILTDPVGWWNDAQFFWGIQMALSEKYALMMEYSPIKYSIQTADPAQSRYFQREPPSHFNFGFRWKPSTWSEIDVTYQRGNQVGANLSVAFDIGQPILPLYDRPYREKMEARMNPLNRRLADALYESGFNSIGIFSEGTELWIRAKNDHYFYNTRAIGVMARIVAEIVPFYFRTVHLVLTENEIPLLEFITTRYDIGEWYAERLTTNEFFFLARINTSIRDTPAMELGHRKPFGYGVKPSFESYVNDPSGFFKYRLGLDGWVSYQPWRGMSFVVALEGYPFNNISSSVAPLTDAVRSDIALYKEKDLALGRLMFDQLYKLEKDTYGRLSAGYLETEFAGFDGEVARSFADGRFLAGVGSSIVKKREPGSPFGLKDGINGRTYYTMFINTRINVPELDAALDVKAGRFLGGDTGARFTVSKIVRGVTLYGWYSATNTSVFKDANNRGYHDKGVGITIPIYIFQGHDSKTAYSYAVVPWTRDVAQDIFHFNTVFDFLGRTVKLLLDKDKGLFYK